MVEFKGLLDENAQKAVDNRSFKIASKIILIFCAIVLLVGVIGLIFGKDNEDLTYAIYFIVWSVIFYPIYLGVYYLIRKLAKNKSTLISSQTEQSFQFFEDRFVASQIKGDEFNDFIQAKYSIFTSVIETKENYLLYISKIQCYVIKKADLTSGSLEEFNQILTTNLGKKFKPLKTKQQNIHKATSSAQ